MGGFYLEDFAVWVRTQKGSILRGVICLILLLFAGITVFKAFSMKDALLDVVAENNEVLAQDEYDLNRLNETAAGITRNTSHELFTPTDDGGSAIATLQSSYGNFRNDDEALIVKHLLEIRNGKEDTSVTSLHNGLIAYVASDSLCNPWFSNIKAPYKWTCLSNQTVVVDNVTEIPAIFTCGFNNNASNILAVAVGTFNHETGLLDSVSVYTTYAGLKILNDDTVGLTTKFDTTPGDILKYDTFGRDEITWRQLTAGIVVSSEGDVPVVSDIVIDDGSDLVDFESDEPSESEDSGFDINKILEGFGT